MPRPVVVMKIDPVRKTYVPLAIEGGRNLARPIMRVIRAKQIGWRELCKIQDRRLMGVRKKADGPGTETYDAGPTPLIVAADACAEKGLPGFRLLGGTATAGTCILFGQGIGGGMVNCPVDSEWLDRMLVWLPAEDVDADGTDEQPIVSVDETGDAQ
jgi:hypothetical protein